MLKFPTALLATAAMVVIGLSNERASAAPQSSATISATQVGPSLYQYTLTLTNGASSTTPIATFWYAWIPGQDYMATSPSDITVPAGWSDVVTNAGGSDGYAIQWDAGSPAADVAAGSTLTGFSYESADTPAVEFGNSPFYPTVPIVTSFTYSAGVEQGTGEKFLVSVPEPATLGMAIPAILLLMRRRRATA